MTPMTYEQALNAINLCAGASSEETFQAPKAAWKIIFDHQATVLREIRELTGKAAKYEGIVDHIAALLTNTVLAPQQEFQHGG